MRRIDSFISRPTVVVQRSATVAEATRQMTAHEIGAVPVLDGNRLAGIFTERDLMTRVVSSGLDPSRTRVEEVMSTSLLVAEGDEDYEVSLRRMQRARVRHLLVLRDGRLSGVISSRDLLAVEVDERDEEIKLLNAYIHDIPVDVLAHGALRPNG